MASRGKPKRGLSLRQRFERYVARARELDNEPLITNEERFSYTFTWRNGQQYQELILPNETNFRSYLLALRKFLLIGEPVFVSNIMSQSIRCLRLNTIPKDQGKHDELLRVMLSRQDEWRKAYQKASVVTIDGTEYTANITTDLLFYGGMFHEDDEDKVQELKTLRELHYPLFEVALFNALPTLHEIIVRLAMGIQHGLDNDLFVFPDEASLTPAQ